MCHTLSDGVPPPSFTGKFSIIHTNLISMVYTKFTCKWGGGTPSDNISLLYLYSCTILAEFKVNHYVCYCGTMNWITQNYILQQNGCCSIIWIPTYYIISNWMPFANCYIRINVGWNGV